MVRQKVLVVEDEELMRAGMREFLKCNGYDVVEAGDCNSALRLFKSARPTVAVIDFLLPDGTALDLLPKFKQSDPSVPLLVLTGHGTIDRAVHAVKEGAEQFLAKPIEWPSLLVVLERTIENQRNRRKVQASNSVQPRRQINPFLGTSAAIRHLEDLAWRIAEAESPALILGETGTGKTVLAQWIHDHGPRSQEAFVDFNCAGLSKDLLDTELFGHEKGAFTGAVGAKAGLLDVAHRGTVFLDEIGDMDPQVQPKLLKVLEEKRFRRVGAVADRFVDIRLIAATHQDLSEPVREKRFRSDLYFRISTLPMTVPPLRDREDDVLALVHWIVANLSPNLEPDDIEITPGAAIALSSYHWPGNIRELRNVIERALILRDRDVMNGFVLTEKALQFSSEPKSREAFEADSETWSLVECERRHIIHVINHQGGNVVEAAQVLGISRSALYEKLKKHNISPARLTQAVTQ